ncbi:hypothetical protein TSOC_004085 [Tetrabaena socialis]|uniref:Uncharacterized protein n=1 Tax=Tetrabaena socialis TaxID=47790 RepID=A0A2J8A9U3_9CHLO|nr:hypothetical protein TSOC_004085 [Tetrabaena socialis]|eukprot:PNH09298.1 hypothetical protein TSOC_004085 [Tetrabaena socialis]
MTGLRLCLRLLCLAPHRLRILAEIQAVSPPLGLEEITLCALPLTAAVVRSIAAAAPRLSILDLHSYHMSYCTGLPGSLPYSPTLSGVQGLLRHAAPHLQQLTLCDISGMSGASELQAEPHGLAPLLLRCSRLESLDLYITRTNAATVSFCSGVLSTLAQLPAMRSLEMGGSLAPDAGRTLDVPPGLTQLTRLVIEAAIDLDAAMPALARMRGLAELRFPSHQLQPSHMRQLAALTALTRLEVQGIGAADVPSPEGTAELGSLPAPAPQMLVPLPALLQELHLWDAPSPSVLAALQLPSGPLRLQLPGIWVPAADKGADGCLRESAAEALLAACRQLAGRLWEDTDEWSPFQLDLGGAAPPLSWPDGWGTLFAALRPAAMRHLAIQAASLTLYDVDALVRHLPLLERLSGLELHPEKGGLVGGWDSQLALRAALLVLCAEAPSLADVTIFVDGAEEPLLEAALQAVDWLSQELPTLRDDPPSVRVE